VIQQYAPLLSKFVPGLRETVGAISEVGGNIADGINNVYDDYTESKYNKRNYGFMDGVRSFTRPGASPQSTSLPSAMKKMTKDYGGLHPRLKLKESVYEIDE
jgi:hypothetical protein